MAALLAATAPAERGRQGRGTAAPQKAHIKQSLDEPPLDVVRC